MTVSKLKRIAPVSAALIVGLINAAFGLILGVINFLMMLFLTGNPEFAEFLIGSAELQSVADSARSILIYPATAFVLAFIGTLLVVWAYNIIARRVQLRLELK